ncbi:hypothetical protein LSCM1_05308 [Leishmania martiniquensis]|uniref:Uncharacterized protein n=1 Tax=Leishmania martiniquensis TaxID=1580590 RepID=A0A836KIC4_9TRYP|nr:hypothetical protein LSCM1_05308 [Leishmania martiniquensis]
MAPQPAPPSPPAPSPQPQERRSPYRNHQSTSAVAEAAAAEVPAAPQATSSAQWQLCSPGEHRPHSDGHVGQGGAVFAYASEAVGTLEQQYSDALQRLGTMHRLYERLDAHNHTLASELKRVRQVSDTLQNGLAFQLYNSVRQVKHEMRLLKQYVELLSSSFSNRLHVLQQVVGEELPRFLGRHDLHASLLAHGVEGMLKPMETRVSVGLVSGGASSAELVANAPSPMLGGAAASRQFYSPVYWWNAMSPHPMRPPSAANDPAAPAEMEAHGDADVVHGGGGTTMESKRELSPPDQLSLSDEGDRRKNILLQSPEDALVSRRAYREVQTALADAQRRVVELEQASVNQQADYESRIAQLKAAHRAKVATLKEELALLRRQGLSAQDDGLQQAAHAAGSRGQAGGLVAPATVNQPTQLPRERRCEQLRAARQSSVSSTASTSTSIAPPPQRADGKAAQSSLWALKDAAEEAGRDEGGKSTMTNDSNRDYRRHAALLRASASASASTTEDGSCDARHSIDRTDRHVPLASGSKGGGQHIRGTDVDLHRPDLYPSADSARCIQCAREMLGYEACGGERRRQGQRAHSSGSGQHHQKENRATQEAAGANATVRRSLAYDRLMKQSHAASNSGEKYAAHIESTSAHMPRRSPRSRRQGTCVSARGEGRGAGADLLQSLAAQVAAIDVQGGSRYATIAPTRVRQAPRRLDAKVERVAQGLWAQELLKARSYL